MLGNSIMEWSVDYNPADQTGTWVKVTDHNRAPVNVETERIETKQRMANGTLRKYVVAKKRTWSTSWDMLPSRNDVVGFPGTVDGGLAGEDMEDFQDVNNGAFYMRLRNGSGDITAGPVLVMISDFGKSVVRRSPSGDGVRSLEFWDLDISLEEV